MVHKLAYRNGAQTGKLDQVFQPLRGAFFPRIQKGLQSNVFVLTQCSGFAAPQQAMQFARFSFRRGNADAPQEFHFEKTLRRQLFRCCSRVNRFQRENALPYPVEE